MIGEKGQQQKKLNPQKAKFFSASIFHKLKMKKKHKSKSGKNDNLKWIKIIRKASNFVKAIWEIIDFILDLLG